jgi:hypothetical protein
MLDIYISAFPTCGWFYVQGTGFVNTGRHIGTSRLFVECIGDAAGLQYEIRHLNATAVMDV